MGPTTATVLMVPDITAGGLPTRNGFDAPPGIHKDNLLFAGIEPGGLSQVNPFITLAGLPPWRARTQIEELISADRRKDEFLALLSHELHSPLASIQHAVGVLRSRPSDSTVQRSMYALIERQVHHMTLLAADLLETSQITGGHLHLLVERVDLRVIVRHAVETLESDFKRRNHKLASTWPDAPVWLRADARRLEQVFVNLLGNASKYTDMGGQIAVAVHTYDGHVVVCIRDSGVGIAPDVLPHIFDLFVRADDTAVRSRSGLGIGLALVRMLVNLHGGNVTAASEGLGLGSEFTVRLLTDY